MWKNWPLYCYFIQVPSCSQNAYIVAVKYEDCSVFGKVTYDLLILLDTRSTISLIKTQFVFKENIQSIVENGNFVAINGTRLAVLGTFTKAVRINE